MGSSPVGTIFDNFDVDGYTENGKYEELYSTAGSTGW
jgi:hypothetical protein